MRAVCDDGVAEAVEGAGASGAIWSGDWYESCYRRRFVKEIGGVLKKGLGGIWLAAGYQRSD